MSKSPLRGPASSFFLDKQVMVKQSLFGGAAEESSPSENNKLLLRWVAVIRILLSKGQVADRSIKGTLFQRVFTGADFVTEMLNQLGPSGTRSRAVKTATEMEKANLLRHYGNTKNFRDSSNEFYVPTLHGWTSKNNLLSGDDKRRIDQTPNAHSRDELLKYILSAMILSPDVIRNKEREFFGVDCIDYITNATDICDRKVARALATELMTLGYIQLAGNAPGKKKTFQDNLTRYKAVNSGSTIADFDFIEQLHQNSTVHRARHRITGNMFAVVEYPERLAKAAIVSIECFQSVLSAHVVRVEDSIVHNGVVNVPTQYAGEPLLECIRRGTSYSEAVVSKICRSVLLGLRDFHLRNVIYRGLSLNKVLVSPKGALLDNPNASVKLAFALCASVTGKGQLDVLGNEGISPIYAAPEIFSGDGPALCSPATDVWSFGVMLHVLLTAEFPFARVGGLLELDPSSEVYAHLSPGVVQLLMSALNLEAEARPSTKQLLGHPWVSGQSAPSSSMSSIRSKLMFKFGVTITSVVSGQRATDAKTAAMRPDRLFSKASLSSSTRKLLDRGDTGVYASKQSRKMDSSHSSPVKPLRALLLGHKAAGKKVVLAALGVERAALEQLDEGGALRAQVELSAALRIEFTSVTPEVVLADNDVGYHPFLNDLDLVVYVQSLHDATNSPDDGSFEALYCHKSLQQFKGLDEGVPFIIIFTHIDTLKDQWRVSGSQANRSVEDIQAKYLEPVFAQKVTRNIQSVVLPFAKDAGPPEDFLAPRMTELIFQMTPARQFRLDVRIRAERATKMFSLFRDKNRGVTVGKIGKKQVEAVQTLLQSGAISSLRMTGLKDLSFLTPGLQLGAGLDRIVLTDTTLSVRTASALLTSVEAGANPLRLLVLNGVTFEDGAFQFISRILSKSSYLETLDVSRCALGRVEWAHVARALWNTRSLRSLYAVNSGLGSASLRELIHVFSANDSIERFEIADNEVSRNDIILFAAGIERSFVSKLQRLGVTFGILDADVRTQLKVLYLAKKQRVLRGLRSDLKKAHLKRIQHVEKSTIGSLDLSMCDLTYMGFHKSFSSLESLNLASNQLTRVPSLGNLGMLKELVLRGNSLVDVPPGIDTLQKLELLDISMNRIEAVDSSVGALVSLTCLDARWNRIKAPPEPLFRLTKLQHLLLSHNKIHQISASVFQMASLKTCDFTANELGSASSEILRSWAHHALSLSLQHMQLVFVPVELGRLEWLRELNLCHNRLGSLPPLMVQLTALRTLDVSHNRIVSFPGFIGELNLKTLDYSGNPMTLTPRHALDMPLPEFLKFLRGTQTNKAPYGSVSVSVLGRRRVGKTSLTRHLCSLPYKDYSPTVGCVERELVVNEKLKLVLRDFSDLHNCVELFLSPQSVLVYVISTVDPDLKGCFDELDSVIKRCPEAPVVVVATMVDRASSVQTNNIASFTHSFSRSRPQIIAFSSVSTLSGKGTADILAQIKKIVADEGFAEQLVFNCELQLESYLVSLRALRHPPVMSVQEFYSVAKDDYGITDPGGTLQFLKKVGALIVNAEKIIIHVAWFAHLLGTLLAHQPSSSDQQDDSSIVSLSGFERIWSTTSFKGQSLDDTVQLLKDYHFAFSSPDNPGCCMVPSMLSDDRPLWLWPMFAAMSSLPSSKSPVEFRRRFLLRKHHSYRAFHVFLNRVVGAVKMLKINQNFCVVERADTLAMFVYDEGDLEVYLRGPGGADVLHLVRDAIESVYTVSRLEERAIWKCDQCKELMVVSIEALEHLGATGCAYTSCSSSHSVLIELVAPDLLLREMATIARGDLAFDDEGLLGEGATGTVSLATYNGRRVAVKVFGNVGSDPQALKNFRRECWLLTSLKHPNITEAIGICLHPEPSLVMEFVPFSLHSVVYDLEQEFPFPLQIRIATDVANALKVTHTSVPKIVHRDLKSNNVLLASMDPTADVVAKVADFGEARSISVDYSGRDGLQNPEWLAPEILQNNPYDERSDIYSFGMLVYEMVERKIPFDEYEISKSKFLFEFEAKIIGGLRPTFDDDLMMKSPAAATLASVAEDCWDGRVDFRPTAAILAMKLMRAIPNEGSTPKSAVKRGAFIQRIRALSRASGTYSKSLPTPPAMKRRSKPTSTSSSSSSSSAVSSSSTTTTTSSANSGPAGGSLPDTLPSQQQQRRILVVEKVATSPQLPKKPPKKPAWEKKSPRVARLKASSASSSPSFGRRLRAPQPRESGYQGESEQQQQRQEEPGQRGRGLTSALSQLGSMLDSSEMEMSGSLSEIFQLDPEYLSAHEQDATTEDDFSQVFQEMRLESDEEEQEEDVEEEEDSDDDDDDDDGDLVY